MFPSTLRKTTVGVAVGAIAALTLATAPALARSPEPTPRDRTVTAVTAGPGATRGFWNVVRLGASSWLVSWTSPSELPVGSDRPQIVDGSGAAVGVPTTDGRTVRSVVTATAEPQPSELAVVLSGARLDRAEPALPAAPTSPSRRTAAAAPTLDVDPGVPGRYAVTSSDYVRPSVKVAGMSKPIEMIGHVVEPVADAPTGPRPLVLFLHGRHDYCYTVGHGDDDGSWPCHGAAREVPSQLGYVYVQKLLASQGYTTVSVRVNGINAQDDELPDGGASARATIVQRHLDYWTTIAAAHHVDLKRVVLVGHSRGGEGVDRAAIRIPLGAPYRIVGQVLVAPTDFANQTAADVPTVTLLPYCDGDVSDLEGQRYTDLARDLSAGDTSLKSSVLIMGANHNFFNTEWTPGISKAPSNDDWAGDPTAQCGTKTPTRLTAVQQRAVGGTYIAGAVALFTEPAVAAQKLLPVFDGSRVSVRSAGRAVVLSHALGGDRVLRRPGSDTTLTLAHGADSSFCTGSTSGDYQPGLCGSELQGITTPHWSTQGEQPVVPRTFWQLSWTARGQSAGLHLTRPLDLRSRSLDLRTVVDFRRGPAAVRVRLTDTAGHTVVVDPVGGRTLPALPSAPVSPADGPQVAKLWGQTVRIEPQSAATTIDLAHVSDVDLVADSARGHLWVADLTTTAGTVVPVPATRLPTVSIGSLTVKEGNAETTQIARVPFRLSRPMDRPGHFRVFTVGQRPGTNRVLTIDLAPGQRSGTIPVGYPGGRLDSPDRLTTTVTAGAGVNVMTDEYIGKLVVLDDDPAPRITVTRIATRVAEGRSAQWRVSLDRPADYDVSVLGVVVRGKGRNLTGADVPTSWLEEHARSTRADRTLAALGTRIHVVVHAGSLSTVLSIPTRHDGRREGVETVTLRTIAPTNVARPTTVTSTVQIRSSR